MISTPNPDELQEGIDNFIGPLAQTVLSLIERELDPDGSTSGAAVLQPLRSAVDKQDVDEIGAFLMRIGKDNNNKFNGYFVQVATENAKRKAAEEKPDST